MNTVNGSLIIKLTEEKVISLGKYRVVCIVHPQNYHHDEGVALNMEVPINGLDF